MSGDTRLLADAPDGSLGHWVLRLCSGEEPDLGPIVLPVGPQHLEQLRGEHHLAIFMTFALTDRDELALAVDIGQPQIYELGYSQPSGIDRHEDRAMFEVQ